MCWIPPNPVLSHCFTSLLISGGYTPWNLLASHCLCFPSHQVYFFLKLRCWCSSNIIFQRPIRLWCPALLVLVLLASLPTCTSDTENPLRLQAAKKTRHIHEWLQLLFHTSVEHNCTMAKGNTYSPPQFPQFAAPVYPVTGFYIAQFNPSLTSREGLTSGRL